MGTEAVTFK